MRTLIVFSHLRWDFVYQRPQHLLSRLARDYQVLFVEEPIRGLRSPYLERLSPCENVEVLRPRTTGAAQGFDDSHFAEIGDMLLQYLEEFRITDYAVWFYTPLALPILASLRPKAVIYDCMDELSAFRNARPELVEREKRLLKRADVVFTGGPSLFEVKRFHNENAHCVPSAVDGKHFGQDCSNIDETTSSLIGHVPAPQIGFFGVIDERLDIPLLAALADARPDWQFVMVGPVVKIDVKDLPSRPNLHWLGQQPYERLPHFMRTWEVCLLPFALNESTRFISPTKTLEYMAAGKPIVSTAIRDVVLLYGDAVHIATGPQEFVDACEAYLGETELAARRRRSQMKSHVERGTWDRAAGLIGREIERAVAAASPAETLRAPAKRRTVPLHAKRAPLAPAATEAPAASQLSPSVFTRSPPRDIDAHVPVVQS